MKAKETSRAKQPKKIKSNGDLASCMCQALDIEKVAVTCTNYQAMSGIDQFFIRLLPVLLTPVKYATDRKSNVQATKS